MVRRADDRRRVGWFGVAVVLCLFLHAIPVRGNLPNGSYAFQLPLAPRCLNGSLPATVTRTNASIRGTLTLASDSKGRLLGQWNGGGVTFPVLGRLKITSKAITITLSGTEGKLGGVRFTGTLHDPLLIGPIKGTHALAGFTGTLTIDLSSSPAFMPVAVLTLATSIKGVVTGTGEVTFCGMGIPVSAKGKATAGKTSLTLKGAGFSFSGQGVTNGTGFDVTWTSQTLGAGAKGKGLLIIPPPSEPRPQHIEPLPTMYVSPPVPAGGGAAILTIDAPGATSISLTATGQGCGAFMALMQAGSSLVETQTVGEFGACTLTANITTGAGTNAVYQTSFTVQPTALMLPPLQVVGGIFLPGGLPPASGTTNDPVIVSVDAPGTLINGAEARFFIHLTNTQSAANIRSVLVQVNNADGFAGYWQVPAVITGGLVEVTLQLNEGGTNAPAQLSLRRKEDLGSSNEDVTVELIDQSGDVGASVQQTLPVLSVTSGEVEVTLTWDTLVDLDLHVVEPSGEEVYYGNRTSATGGTLDTDSNAGCNIDGRNTEHVVWAVNAPPGQYTVRVDFYKDCQSLGAQYSVTVAYCGQSQTFNGAFAPNSDDGGGLGSGVTNTQFTVDCGSNGMPRVRGVAAYEKFPMTPKGPSPTSVMVPIRFAQVEIHRASDDAVLKNGNTKQDGTFDIQFTNDGTPGYYVKVIARQNNTQFAQQAQDSNGNIYFARSDGTINEQTSPDTSNVFIQALTSPQGVPAGSGPGAAFNMFDLGITGQTFLRNSSGNPPPFLHFVWTRGQPGLCGDAGTCYLSNLETISVGSTSSNLDDYSDMVILHELGHYFIQHFARDDSPAKVHLICQQIDPRQAWSEGAADWFACYNANSPLYLDLDAQGDGIRSDISNPCGLATGTSDGTMAGNLAEKNVAGILWYLSRTNVNAVVGAMSYMPSSFFADRGVKGADLVDFLDGWFCVGNDNKGDASSGLTGLVVTKYGFPYDFKGPSGCGP